MSFKMKSILVFLCLFASAIAAPTESDAVIAARRRLPALEHKENRDEWGQFDLRYVTAEGTVVLESGRLVPSPNGPDYVMIIEGEVRYIGDDGKIHITKYSSSLDGNHVNSVRLPVPVTPEPSIDPAPHAVVVERAKVVTPEPPHEVVEPPHEVAEPTHVVAKPVNPIAKPLVASSH